MGLINLKKLSKGYIWERIFLERLTEPLHLNLLAIAVSAFGSLRAKIAFDLVLRQQHAYAILACADLAKERGIKEVTLIEFGVASGTGLLNICKLAKRITRETGVHFRIYGFDTGEGMPPPESYRDHPEIYHQGDFPMNHESLRKSLPNNAELIIGQIKETVGPFLRKVTEKSPIGFISIDVDFYSSSRDALEILQGNANQYLPRIQMYLDDLEFPSHNSWCGERLAINEFNEKNRFRKIEQHAFLKSQRIFRNARWIDHMFTVHMLDHFSRTSTEKKRSPTILTNPYLK